MIQFFETKVSTIVYFLFSFLIEPWQKCLHFPVLKILLQQDIQISLISSLTVG
jgi:hypothetical protein